MRYSHIIGVLFLAVGCESLSHMADDAALPPHADGGTAVGDGATPPLVDGGPFVAPSCDTPVTPGLPAGAPVLEVGRWVDIRPQPWIAGGDGVDGMFTLGMAVHPCDPAIIYVCVGSYNTDIAGLFRTTDAGAHWSRIGRLSDELMIDQPIRVRIDPRDPQHLYVVDGVRGATTGFFVSHDGGDTFELASSVVGLATDPGIYPYDMYDVAVDPADFNHVLVSHHSAWGWTDTVWNTSSGVLESRDGGGSWIVHAPMAGWGSGHAINFLSDPEHGIGDGNTWLLGTQGPGMWRTADAGNTWTQVTANTIQHGGGNVYRGAAGALYAAGSPQNLRSTDNGATWTPLEGSSGYNAIFGDGSLIYTAPCFGPSPFRVTDDGGATWRDFNDQRLDSGPYEMALDGVNRVLYTSSWGSGVWALQLPAAH